MILLSHPCLSTPYIPLQIPNYIKARHSHQSGGRSTTHTHTSAVMIDQLPDWCEIRSDRRHHHLMPKAIFLNRLTSWSARNFMHASRRLASSSFDLFPSTMHATCFFLTLQYISFFFIFGIIWKLLLTKYSTIYVHRV
jgi:hypothetical protein